MNCPRCDETDIQMFVKGDKRCKKCLHLKAQKFAHSKGGVVSHIYNGQKTSSKKRGHPAPSYTKKELKEWLFSQKLFHELFDMWVIFDYDKDSKPSCDRVDDNVGYMLSNLELKMWCENSSKEHLKHLNGSTQVNKDYKGVEQITLDGEVVGVYFSMNHAGRVTGINQQNISAVCLGKRKTAGTYVWRFL